MERAASLFRTNKQTFGIRVFDVRKAVIIVGVLASEREQVGSLKMGVITGVEINWNVKKDECKGLKFSGNKISD